MPDINPIVINRLGFSTIRNSIRRVPALRRLAGLGQEIDAEYLPELGAHLLQAPDLHARVRIRGSLEMDALVCKGQSDAADGAVAVPVEHIGHLQQDGAGPDGIDRGAVEAYEPLVLRTGELLVMASDDQSHGMDLLTGEPLEVRVLDHHLGKDVVIRVAHEFAYIVQDARA